MHRSMKLLVGLVMVVGVVVGAAGTASAASTRLSLTLTCDREVDDMAFVAVLMEHAGGNAGSADLQCGPNSLSGSRSDKNPQFLPGSPTGITITGYWVRSGGATVVCAAEHHDLAAKVRCEDSSTGVGVTLVAR
jgi:hypothetical protein